MDSDKYLEGKSMQRPPLFESDSFIYWINRFETYVKSKDLDLWHVINNDDFQPIEQNPKTKLDEVIPFEKQSDDLKKKLAKNNEAKMVIYNAFSRKEYERIFMLNTGKKKFGKTLLITHQDESIDGAFARFNSIITSLKALDEGYSSKNYVRKFLRALHPKWRANVMEIEESINTASTLMETQNPLLKDEDGEEVDVHMYRSMLGSLMYLTSSRPDIMFAVCACARYQVNPKVSDLHAVKRIFSDYAGASLDRKSTTGGFEQIVDFLNVNPIRYALTINPTIYTSCIEQFWATFKVKTVNRKVQLQALVDGKKIIVTEASVRRDLQLNDEEGTDFLPNATIFEELTRMGYEKLS
ncbi:hypothetical protein Tco_0397563 [Tanacetum coccineum]